MIHSSFRESLLERFSDGFQDIFTRKSFQSHRNFNVMELETNKSNLFVVSTIAKTTKNIASV